MMTLYTQPNCNQCRMIHILLSKKPQLKYEECQDIEAAKRAGVTHTPAMEVDGKILQGKELVDFIKGAN